MKKFLMYVIIVVTCLFLGFTIYYLTQNNENIYITISKDESIYVNKGDSLWLDNMLVWTKPYKTTTIDVTSADTSVVKYDQNTKTFECVGGGMTAITIKPSNEKFGPFIFEVYVGDGTVDNPYVVNGVDTLAKIGNDSEHRFELSNSYILTKDLDLATYNNGTWVPLGELTGNFNGDGHTLYNLNITNGTNVGLFASVAQNSIVEDIKFVNATIDGQFATAGVVAGVNKGTIGKCEVISAKITNTLENGHSGGIVGDNINTLTNALVNMCSSTVELKCAGVAGGLVGFNHSSIVLNSRAIVNKLESTSSNAILGGIVGSSRSTYNELEEVYTASAIKNSFAVINSVAGEGNIGAVVGFNDEQTYTGQVSKNIYEGCLYNLSDGVTVSAVASGSEHLDSASTISQKTRAELLLSSTYEEYKYNFDTVWTLVENSVANINYQAGYETYKVTAIGKEITKSNMSLLQFLNKLKSGDTAYITATYRVTENCEIDLENAEWQTIAPSINSPMTASIIVDDGVSCVIKNFKLNNDNTSFFGYISGNTLIKNIKFENVTMGSCTGDYSAIVATGLLSGAVLDSITVKNLASINTQANTAGVICALNKGSINNCRVENDNLANFKVVRSDRQISMGVIAGQNDGVISKAYANNIRLLVDTSSDLNGGVNLGGIVGISSSTISESRVEGVECDNTIRGTAYLGGIVGYTTANTFDVAQCAVVSSNFKNVMTNTDAFMGGIVGYTSAGVTITGCVFNEGSLSAGCVGGMTAILYGTLYSSYIGSDAQVIGDRVGGLVYLTYGRLTDCYVLADLKAYNKSSYACGLTLFVGPDCYIEHCFSNATFTGDGKFYAESWSEFRTTKIVQWFSNISNPTYWGYVGNNIVLANNGAKIQDSFLFGIREGWIDATYEECSGQQGNYEVFKDEAGFNSDIWIFSEGLPTLRYVASAD